MVLSQIYMTVLCCRKNRLNSKHRMNKHEHTCTYINVHVMTIKNSKHKHIAWNVDEYNSSFVRISKKWSFMFDCTWHVWTVFLSLVFSTYFY